MCDSSRSGGTRRPAYEAVAIATVALADLLVLEMALSLVGVATAPVAVIVGTASLTFGAMVSMTASWALRLGRGATAATFASGTVLVPAVRLFEMTGSVAAFALMSLAATVVAVAAVAAALAVSWRTVMWLINRYRTRRGRLTVEDALIERFRPLPFRAQIAVAVLGVPSSLFLTVMVFVDATPVDQPGIVGTVASTVARLLSILQGLFISVLAGAIVMIAQSIPLMTDESGPTDGDTGKPGGGV